MRGIRKRTFWTLLDSFRERNFHSSCGERERRQREKIKKLDVTSIRLMIYFLFFIHIYCDSLSSMKV
jgi:hypothetical protein